MIGGTISYLLSEDPLTRQLFDGFWFPDVPAKISKIPALLILNTDKSTGPGQHWCAAYISKSKHCEYFDPLAASPHNENDGYSFLNHLSKFSKSIEYNIIPVQDPLAKTCGHHCIYFCYLRARGFPLNHILNNAYSKNLVSNDALVSKFVVGLKK